MAKSVYDETGGVGSISRHLFYAIMSTVLVYGFILASFAAKYTANMQLSMPVLLVLGIVIPFVGIYVASKESALLALIGFHLIVAPMGAMIGPALAAKEYAQPGVVVSSALLTAGIAGFMGLLGVLIPRAFENMGAGLFAALCTLLVVRIAAIFFPILNTFTLIDYCSAGLFSLYIAYDMCRAHSVTPTISNAIRAAVDLFLSMLNLFLSILRIKSND